MSEERHDLAIILTNRALCCFDACDQKTCARLAGCAWHLDPAYKRAQQWLEEGLKAMALGSSAPLQSSSWAELPGLVTWETPCLPRGHALFRKREEKCQDMAGSQGLRARPCSFPTSGQRQGPSTHEAAAKHEGRAELADLLINMAAVGIETRDWKQALQCATAAALLPPANQALSGRAWILRARALEGLGHAHAAQSLAGADLPGVKEEEEALKKRSSAREQVRPMSRKSTEETVQRDAGLPEVFGRREEDASGRSGLVLAEVRTGSDERKAEGWSSSTGHL